MEIHKSSTVYISETDYYYHLLTICRYAYPGGIHTFKQFQAL
jgi:hypothetical protein